MYRLLAAWRLRGAVVALLRQAALTSCSRYSRSSKNKTTGVQWCISRVSIYVYTMDQLIPSGTVASPIVCKPAQVWDTKSLTLDADKPAKLRVTAAVAAHDKDINAVAVAPNDSGGCVWAGGRRG